MSFLARLAFRLLKLPGRPDKRVTITRNIPVTMPDGTVLLTDRYVPEGGEGLPVVLVRSPYGRSLGLAIGAVYPLVWNGFQVVFQSCRGTGGSGGRFNPHHDERADGLATVGWIKQQPWSGAGIVTYGMSYLGYVQWAIAREAPDVRAMSTQVTMANFASMTYAGDSLLLETAMGWTRMMSRMAGLQHLLIMLETVFGIGKIRRKQWMHLPLGTMDEVTAGKPVSFWRDWMTYDSVRNPWWQPMDFHRSIGDVQTPVTMVAGWHDIFTPWQVRDFQAMREAGREAWISIGPWGHTSSGIGREAVVGSLALFRSRLHGDHSALREKKVRLFVQKAEAWREFERWPPEGARDARWFLQAGNAIAEAPAPESGSERLRYDPADPTPSVGGPALSARAFSVDNRALELRADVLCFTSGPLPVDLDVIGPVEADLYVSSDAPSADFFVRLCDVDERGVSRNVCDGLQRASLSADGTEAKITVQLWPTAWRFRAGHRLRVQVSGGAFPRWARNTGTGEPLGTARELRVATTRILFGPAQPSAIRLPSFAVRA